MERHSSGPALWAYFLIVIGALLLIFGSVSMFMHLMQRRRRISLQRRVESGEVDLEAMGIKRVTVPSDHVKGLPLFTYQSEPDMMSAPPTPHGPGHGTLTPRSARSSRRSRRAEQNSDVASQFGSRSVRSLRSKRSSVAGSADTTATNNQPKCQICLESFEHRITIIRELTCGHIFHPECIDEYLIRNSSLCPICKQNMLPPGYSPKITNAMVRRERALRRLRQRVDLDDSSLETGHVKIVQWSRRLFKSQNEDDKPVAPASTLANVPTTTSQEISLEPVSQSGQNLQHTPIPENSPVPPVDVSQPEVSLSTAPLEAATSRPQQPPATKAPRPKTHKTKPRALSLLPTQPEDSELKPVGRKSPSSFARQRMRELAHRNAPIEDPDRQPKCESTVTAVLVRWAILTAHLRASRGAQGLPRVWIGCGRCRPSQFSLWPPHVDGGLYFNAYFDEHSTGVIGCRHQAQD